VFQMYSRREKEFSCRIEIGYRSTTWTGSFAFVITRVAIAFTALKIISQRSERRENKLTKSANFFWSVFQPFHQYLFSSPAPGVLAGRPGVSCLA
jgi:hypothetical protein